MMCSVHAWAVGALLCVSTSALATQLGAPVLRVTLAPVANAAQHKIDAVDVTIQIEGTPVAAGTPLLQMPIVIYNVETVAKALEDLEASDAHGALPLSVRDDPEGGDEFNRHWIANRPTEGALSVRYRAPISGRLAPLGAAPPTELRADGLSFSAGGVTFLTLPANETPYRVTVHWDLSALPSGAVALSSLGGGDVTSARAITADRLGQMYFMAGQIRASPLPPPSSGYFSAWQGSPPFDARALMQWTGHLYDRYVVFFKGDARSPYAVFLRPNPVNPGGGIGQEHSFVATFDEHTVVEDLKFTLAHEMLHTFIGGLEGDENLVESWFSEGLAVYYQRVLPVRFGQMSADEFLADLNKTAGRYYTDARADTPNSEIPEHFWSDTLIRVLPYDRGSLYFATVDDAVRKASHGKRSLDDLLLAMLQRRKEHGGLHRRDWEEILDAELGARGVDDFHAMLAGKQVLPASDAFGPCFRRTTRPLRRYVLGFDPTVMAERKRIVRGVLPGSAAAKAGLRDGDEILKPFGQDSVQEDQHQTLTLQIRRDGKDLAITYLPRGETVQAHQWERVAGCT
jgi:predicted metalloprotease with PDZ domain